MYGLGNRVPDEVLLLEVAGAALALGLLALHLATIGQGVFTVILAAALVALILLVTFDLDRPTRGLIECTGRSANYLRISMDAPPAAAAPTGR